jgi:hypothetical protein
MSVSFSVHPPKGYFNSRPPLGSKTTRKSLPPSAKFSLTYSRVKTFLPHTMLPGGVCALSPCQQCLLCVTLCEPVVASSTKSLARARLPPHPSPSHWLKTGKSHCPRREVTWSRWSLLTPGDGKDHCFAGQGEPPGANLMPQAGLGLGEREHTRMTPA